MADTCARCGLPFREGEDRDPAWPDRHFWVSDCHDRLTAVASVAALYVEATDHGEEPAVRGGLYKRLRAALAGEEPRE